MRNCLAITLTIGLCGSALAQNAVLNWEKTDALATSPEQISFTKVATLPGGDVLVGGTAKSATDLASSSRIVLERIRPNATVVWSKRYPSDTSQQMKFDDWKVLANGYVYVSGSGTAGFDSKISLADGSQANELLIPESTLTSAIALNYTTYFAKDIVGAWTRYDDFNDHRSHTIAVVTADSQWNIGRQTVSTTEDKYQWNGTNTSNAIDYKAPVILLSKNGAHVFFGGIVARENDYSGYTQGIAYTDFFFDTTGVYKWKGSGGTNPGQPHNQLNNIDSWGRVGIGPNENLQVIFERIRDDVAQPETGTAWNTSGVATSVDLHADLAQYETLNSGAEYRSINNPFVGAVQSLEKRDSTGATLLLGPLHADVVTRIPFELASATLNPGTNFAFTLTPDNGGAVSNYTFSPAPQGFFADAAISSDTGEVYIVGQNNYDTGKYGGWIAKISQNAVATSESYSVPAGALFNSPTSVLLNDRFAVGITPKIITTTHHGYLYMRTDGTFGYQPAAGFVGTDVFYYSIQRPNFPPSTAEVALNVH